MEKYTMGNQSKQNEIEKPTPREVIKTFNLQLTASGSAPGLQIGDEAPNFTLLNQYSKNVNLGSLIKKGSVILSFYRGDWCRHCNREIQEIEKVKAELQQLGVTIIAIAPQLPKDALKMAKKNNVSFDLLSDPTFEVIDLYKLKFELSKDVQFVYENKFNLNLPNHTANKTWQLPIPATYVINQNHKITGSYLETDYSLRLTGSEILELISQS